MFFCVIYILFVISSLLFGSIYIGPMSMRQYMTIVMIIMCVYNQKKIWIDRSWILFILFLICLGITSMIHNNISLYIHNLIGYYLVAYVGCWATVIIKNRYNINIFIYTILSIGIIDSIFTILQAYGNGYSLEIGYIFSPNDIENMDVDEFASTSIPGIFGDVYNGYVLLVSTILSYIIIIKNQSIFKYIPFLICFLASFFAQQRFPFYINIVFLFIFIIKYIKLLSYTNKILYIIIVSILISFIIPYFISFSESHDMRYSVVGMDGGGREGLYHICKEYILQYPFSANIYHLRQLYGFSPHFLIYNMFIYGGFFGFIFLLGILVIHIRKVFNILKLNVSNMNIVNMTLAMALLGFIGNTLTHNSSFVTGDVLYWMIFGGLSVPRYKIN